jgi:hypothetical protein
MAALRPFSAWSVISALLTGAYATAIPGSVHTWSDWTCPPPSTSVLSLTQTQYVPVTTTETDLQTTQVTQVQTSTVIVYQTIISTQTVTTVSFDHHVFNFYLPLNQTERTSSTTETSVLPTTLTEYNTVTQTETTPVTVVQLQTAVTTSPVTLTATEAIQIYSSTTRLTSLKLCPSRIVNPTFTVQAPLPTDWT